MTETDWGPWARAALLRGVDCPDEETLRVWSEQPARDPEGEIALHVARCAHCQFEVSEMKDFFDEPDGSADELASELRARLAGWEGAPASGRRRWLWPVAAGLAVVASGAFWLLRDRPPEVPVLEGGSGVVRGENAPALVEPVGPVPSAPRRLVWRPAPGERGPWQVRLEAVDGRLLWSSSSPDASVGLPEEVTSALTPGSRYIWRVAGTGAEAAGSFRIERPGQDTPD